MIEIERKYLLAPSCKWAVIKHCEGTVMSIKQGYILTGDPELRIRTVEHEFDSTNTMTGKQGTGLVREEFEMPLNDLAAQLLWNTVGEKKLFKQRYRSGRWEIDVFEERYEGLILAEIELHSVEEIVAFPEWMTLYVLHEVTDDPKYKNKNLALGRLA